MEFKDYYQILGVDSEADTKTIKTAYRKLARKYHPDMNPEEGAEDRFKKAAEAYEVLKDPERRAQYDELRRYGGGASSGFEPPPGWHSAGTYNDQAGHSAQDFSDFFSSIFGEGSSQRSHSGLRGQDAEIEMPIFLEDTLSDASKRVTYRIPVIEHGRLQEVEKQLNVKIPAGVTDGERIRLKGQGGIGQGGAPNGDLYLHIRLVPHPLFDVEGHNLILTVPVAPWEAALGARVRVPTLDGKLDLTIPPNSQTDNKLRIKQKGLATKAGRGDLIARIKVVMPTDTSGDARALWESLAEKASFDPRAQWSN